MVLPLLLEAQEEGGWLGVLLSLSLGLSGLLGLLLLSLHEARGLLPLVGLGELLLLLLLHGAAVMGGGSGVVGDEVAGVGISEEVDEGERVSGGGCVLLSSLAGPALLGGLVTLTGATLAGATLAFLTRVVFGRGGLSRPD